MYLVELLYFLDWKYYFVVWNTCNIFIKLLAEVPGHDRVNFQPAEHLLLRE